MYVCFMSQELTNIHNEFCPIWINDPRYCYIKNKCLHEIVLSINFMVHLSNQVVYGMSDIYV